MPDTSVLVVGGSSVGLATALCLARQGVRTTLVERHPAVSIHHGAVDASSVPRSIPHRVGVGEWMDEGAELEALMAESSDARVSGPVSMDDLCFLAHTSGTTGSPKGVMLTHANVTWNLVNFLTSGDFRSSDVTVAIAPFFRVGGTGVNVLPLLFVGGTVAVAGDGGADEILRLMERHRVTVGFGNPDILEALVRSGLWARADLSSVRFVLTGGAPVAERLIRAYLDRGVTLLQGYGLSEAGPLALLLDPAIHLQAPPNLMAPAA